MTEGGQITEREAAVLAAIGRRLTNPEIAAEFHVSVRTVESHIAALRRKLDADSRAALIEDAVARAAGVVARPITSFVGRDADLAGVASLLARSALVTIAGPGGSGKTRLAVEVAARAIRPTVLVRLQDVAASEVVAEVARQVGVGPGAANLAAACSLVLSRRPSLLLLDNCDLVTSSVAALAGDLLTRTPGLVVLTTSRSPLGRPEETVYRLAPLSTQDAIVLLTDRARASVPALDLDGALLARLSARLDGIPLAIELAAARLGQLSPAELARELDRDLLVLDQGGVDEQRSLGAMFARSFELLTEAEQALATRLAALPGPVDLDLAEAVGGPGAAATTLRLLDRSFVVPAPDRASFRVLEVMRELLLARTSDAVAADARRRHAHHVARVVATVAATARTNDSSAAAARFADLIPAATAALTWALDAHDPVAMPLARDLAVAAEQYGPSAGLVAVLGRAVGDGALLAAAHTEDLLDIGIVLCYGDLDLVDALARHALERNATEDRSCAAAHLLAGLSAVYHGRADEALHHLAIADAAQADDGRFRAVAAQGRAMALSSTNPAGAIEEFRNAAKLFARTGDAMHVNNARFMMACTAADAGVELTRAIGWADQCVAYAASVANRHELAHALLTRSRLADRADDVRTAIDIFEAVGDLRCLARCHVRLAELGHDPVAHLERAHQIATAANDVGRRALVLERLAPLYASEGRLREAALALGTLGAIAGDERAASALPAGFPIEDWALVVAEGRARARTA